MRGLALAGFLRALLGQLLLSLLLIGGGLWLLELKLSSGLEEFLRKKVFTDPREASFAKAGIDLLRGRAFVTELRVGPSSRKAASWHASAKEFGVQVSLWDLASGAWGLRRLTLKEPTLEFDLSSPAASSDETVPPSAPTRLDLFDKFSVREFTLDNGVVRFKAGGAPLELRSIHAIITRSQEGVSLHGEGVLGEGASVYLDSKLEKLGSLCPSKGEIRLSELSIPALARLFPPDPEMSLTSGRLSLNTQFTCLKGWLTASHLVEIKGFKVEVSEKKKELFGIAVKYLKDLYQIDHLSFVVPMNGSVEDPHIGIGSSVQQILLKILGEKSTDKDKVESLAKKGGDYFGGKIDKALRAWLMDRNKKR